MHLIFMHRFWVGTYIPKIPSNIPKNSLQMISFWGTLTSKNTYINTIYIHPPLYISSLYRIKSTLALLGWVEDE